MIQPLIEAKHLKKYFVLKKNLFSPPEYVRAVDDISFFIREQEVLGLVGESGCGKSTLARILLRLLKADRGEVWYNGEDILKVSYERMRHLRQELQIIFQDPFGSLNPRFKIKDIISEGLYVFQAKKGKQFIGQKVDEVLNLVGLSPEIKERYPHEFSGGQRQRISIARSIILNPKCIICDEPVSALDVSIQAQIINLLKDLKESLKLSYLFISHDLSVVRYISDRIMVVYLGKIVESGNAETVCRQPLHPYTQALIAAIPSLKVKDKEKAEKIGGDLVQKQVEKGCNFRLRCLKAQKICGQEEPDLKELSDGHWVSCHLYD